MLGESKYERIQDDAYWTPEWCTQVLLDHIKFRGDIWEPACGKGNISKVLKKTYEKVLSTDINDWEYGEERQYDFLNHHSDFIGTIITNPPYVLAKDFVIHALDLTKFSKGQVAMLLRNEWDSASGRTYLFTEKPFMTKLVLTKRPNWTEQRIASPRHNFSWFIWDWQYKGLPNLIYQRKNNE